MEIAFASKALKKLCENEREADRRIGKDAAKRLRARLADLMAASKLGDIPAGNPHPLRGERHGQCAIRLAGGKRLVFEANDEPIPITTDGTTDWRRIVSIRIVFIGDYHD